MQGMRRRHQSDPEGRKSSMTSQDMIRLLHSTGTKNVSVTWKEGLQLLGHDISAFYFIVFCPPFFFWSLFVCLLHHSAVFDINQNFISH